MMLVVLTVKFSGLQRLSLISTEDEVVEPLNEPEEKLLVRLGLTYGILRRLGFSEARVVQCLHSVRGVDFEEAYDWVISASLASYGILLI